MKNIIVRVTRSISAYLGINFFELQGENNIYPYMETIGSIINVHQDNIEKQGNKLTIAISPVSVYLASILTEEIDESIDIKEYIKKCIEEIPTLILSQFETQLSAVTNYLPNEDFIKIIAFIYKNDIFPLIRLKEKIPLDKAPLFSDVIKHTPFYYSLVFHRNYRYAEESIYYEDILAELGFDETSKQVSKHFPYIGMGVSKPKAARLKKIDNFKKLKKHINIILKEQGFPLEITSKIVSERKNGIYLPRISTFKIKGVRYKKRREFEKKYVINEANFRKEGYKLAEGYIKKIDSQNIYSKYCNPEFYSKDKILGHGQPDHDTVMEYLLKNHYQSIVTEMPIWIKYSSSFLTGHIDLLEIDKDTIIIADYKPKSFFHSIPQITIYALVVMKTLDVRKVKCVMFDKDKIWKFEPISLLKNVMNFIKSLEIKQFWFEYAYFLLAGQ